MTNYYAPCFHRIDFVIAAFYIGLCLYRLCLHRLCLFTSDYGKTLSKFLKFLSSVNVTKCVDMLNFTAYCQFFFEMNLFSPCLHCLKLPEFYLISCYINLVKIYSFGRETVRFYKISAGGN